MGKPEAKISKKVFIELHYEGKSGLEIARFFGIGRTTVGRYYKRFDLTPWTISEIRQRKFWRGSEEQYEKVSKIVKQRNGPNHPNYRGGHIDKNGYRIIHLPGRYVKEHRYIMEQQLGRRLMTNEDVHHKDHDKLNNDLSNLQLLTKSEHATLHWDDAKRKNQSEKIKAIRAKKFWNNKRDN